MEDFGKLMNARINKINEDKKKDVLVNLDETKMGDIAKLAEQGVELLGQIEKVNKKLQKKGVLEAKYLESALNELWDLYEQIGFNVGEGDYD